MADINLILEAISADAQAHFQNANDVAAIWRASNGAFYAALVAFIGDNQNYSIWKSTDDGETWTLPDAGFYDAEKPSFQGRVVQVGDLVYVVAVNFYVSVYTFDCSTDTWSTVSFQEDTMGGSPVGMWVTGPGAFYVIYYDNFATPGSSSIRGRQWDGSSWANDIDLGVNSGLGTDIYPFTLGSIIDDDGRIHVFYSNSTFDSWWYQAIEADASLGDYHEFTEIISMMGAPLVVDGQLVLAASGDGYTFLLIGDSTTTPSWSQSGPVDSMESGTVFAIAPPQFFTDGTGTYWVLLFAPTDLGFESGLFRLSTSTDLETGWVAETIYDADVDPLPPGLSGNRYVLPIVNRGEDGAVFVAADWDVGDLLLGGFVLSINDEQIGNEFI